MKTSYFTYLRIFWDILYKNNIFSFYKILFIQYVPKYHQKLGCQANGGRAPGAPPLDPPMDKINVLYVKIGIIRHEARDGFLDDTFVFSRNDSPYVGGVPIVISKRSLCS